MLRGRYLDQGTLACDGCIGRKQGIEASLF